MFMRHNQVEHQDIFFVIKRRVIARLSSYPMAKQIVRIAFKMMWWSSLIFPIRRYIMRRRYQATLPHVNPPLYDFALEVPFNYVPDPVLNAPAIAVMCHIYYEEMTEWIKSYMCNIPFSFDLYITTDTESKKTFIESHFKYWSPGNVEIRIAPNRGRDIAPKLIALKNIYSKYEFILHVHSKHSPYGNALDGWRDYLFNTLLGSEEIVQNVFEIFQQFPTIGMIAPQHFEHIRPAIGWGHNYSTAKKLAEHILINIKKDTYIDFPSGSMFWARSKALEPLLMADLKSEDFQEEKGQMDGTLAHSIERLYFLICEQAGYDWLKIALRQRLTESTSRIFAVDKKEQLIDFTNDHLIRLKSSREDIHSPENRIMQYVQLHA